MIMAQTRAMPALWRTAVLALGAFAPLAFPGAAGFLLERESRHAGVPAVACVAAFYAVGAPLVWWPVIRRRRRGDRSFLSVSDGVALGWLTLVFVGSLLILAACAYLLAQLSGPWPRLF